MTTAQNPAALAAVAAVADRLADPAAYAPAGDPARVLPQSLAGGAVGIALLHAERARSGTGDPRVAHAWLAAASADGASTGQAANLFYGVPALAFALAAAADRPTRYRNARTAAETATTEITRQRLQAADHRLGRGEPPLMAEFDLIRGLTGLGAIHLKTRPDDPITADVLAYLVRLTEPTDRAQPGWWTPVSPNGAVHPDFPGGHGNAGMAHGISAALVLLSQAMRAGITVAGHAEAIGRIYAWFDRWQHHDDQDHSPWWPGYITAATARGETTLPRPRPSWCYGPPGTARALHLAARALNDSERRATAERAMASALQPDQIDRLEGDIGLCHGLAGVLQSAWRMNHDAPTNAVAAALPRLTRQLIDALADTTDPELMDGAAGAALALHSIGTGTAPASGWDTFLLLA